MHFCVSADMLDLSKPWPKTQTRKEWVAQYAQKDENGQAMDVLEVPGTHIRGSHATSPQTLTNHAVTSTHTLGYAKTDSN